MEKDCADEFLNCFAAEWLGQKVNMRYIGALCVIKMHQDSCMNALGLMEDCLKCQISPLVNGHQTQTKPNPIHVL